MIPVPLLFPFSLTKTKEAAAKMTWHQFIDQDNAEQCATRFTHTVNQEVSNKNTKIP